MIKFLVLLSALGEGLLLGVMFFGGLWWTVRKGLASNQPALWFFGSLLLRLSLALVGFYFVGQGIWQRLVACLLGFVLARFITIRLTVPPQKNCHANGKEASHAS